MLTWTAGQTCLPHSAKVDNATGHLHVSHSTFAMASAAVHALLLRCSRQQKTAACAGADTSKLTKK